MSATKIQLAKFDDDRPMRVLDDVAAFQAGEPRGSGYHLTEARAVLIGGRWYTLAADCPDDGLDDWAPGGTLEELAKDAAIEQARAYLTAEQLVAVGLAGAKTRAEKIAQQEADDAEAEAAKP